MTRKEFEDIAQEAFDSLPDQFREKVDNVSIVVEDYPSLDLQESLGTDESSLLGLYQGVPYGYRGTWYGTFPTVPDTIFLFQKNIEAECRGEEMIRRKIAEVLYHELGHYFGMSEKEVRSMLRNFV
ncbi:MAG TPA: metallopeptidase family protein [Bacteroidota bacterium]|nr:metallopeptidase family protein [Bacteroidota bacterium]